MNGIRTPGPRLESTARRLAPALLVVGASWLAACSSGGAGSTAGTTAPIVTRGVLSNENGLQVSDRPLAVDGAVVTMDGAPADASMLRPGMRVTASSDLGVTTRIAYEEDVKGPLDAILSDGTLIVMGQTVRLSAATLIDGTDLDGVQGDVFEVSGLRLADGAIDASYVERKRESPRAYSVRGPVRELDTNARLFLVGSLLVDYSTAELDDDVSLRDGVSVEVKQEALAYEPGSHFLSATKVERDDAIGNAFAPNFGGSDVGGGGNGAGTEYEIDGVVTRSLADSAFAMGTLEVEIGAGTRFRDGQAADLVVDRRVEVEGRIDARGVLLARDVEFDDDDDSTVHHDDRPDTRGDDDDRDDDTDRGGADDDRDDDTDNRIEIEGVVTAVDAAAGTLDIDSLHIVTASATRFENAADERVDREAFFAMLQPGRTVVKVRWIGRDASSPSEIEIED